MLRNPFHSPSGTRRVKTSRNRQQASAANRHRKRGEWEIHSGGNSTCGVSNNNVTHKTDLTIQRKRTSQNLSVKPKPMYVQKMRVSTAVPRFHPHQKMSQMTG